MELDDLVRKRGQQGIIHVPDSVVSLSWSADGKFLAVSYRRELIMWGSPAIDRRAHVHDGGGLVRSASQPAPVLMDCQRWRDEAPSVPSAAEPMLLDLAPRVHPSIPDAPRAHFYRMLYDPTGRFCITVQPQSAFRLPGGVVSLFSGHVVVRAIRTDRSPPMPDMDAAPEFEIHDVATATFHPVVLAPDGSRLAVVLPYDSDRGEAALSTWICCSGRSGVEVLWCWAGICTDHVVCDSEHMRCIPCSRVQLTHPSFQKAPRITLIIFALM